MRRRGPWLPLLVLAATTLGVVSATGTPYWTAEDANRSRDPGDTRERGPAQPRAGGDYLSDFFAAAWFIAARQVSDPEDPEYGGIREAEHLPEVVQTDNTSESIWMFSRYYEITEDTAILPYLERSWIYVNNFPAYDEEGPVFPAQGYYRYYNCGWALRAGMKYEDVFGDTTHRAYVDSCANYLASHTLSLDGNQFHQDVNPSVLAWSAGNLYRYGIVESDSLWKEKGWKRGKRAKDWVDADSAILRREVWAMSGGAVMWGLLESYFQEFPAEEEAWVAFHADIMDTVADEGEFENAWNGWYALAHDRLHESTDDPIWAMRHRELTDMLLAFDTDEDGGIPANPADADSMDQAWVTAYLGFMGLEPLISLPTGAPPLGPVASSIALFPNRPNPFGPQTSLPFRLSEAHHVTIDVTTAAGRRVARLLDRVVPAGGHSVTWDGRDDRGRLVASGVYFYRLQAGRFTDARKLLLLR